MTNSFRIENIITATVESKKLSTLNAGILWLSITAFSFKIFLVIVYSVFIFSEHKESS